MNTECQRNGFDFQPLGRRDVVAKFDGGAITFDAGGILLRELEFKTGIVKRFADCFTDHRNPDFIEHTVLELVKQRIYCARGEMENRIKEQQLMLFADRTSCASMRANPLRLYFSSVAYVLMTALRQFGLAGTELAKAQCDTMRLKLLKIGAQVRVTFRKVWLSLAECYPYRSLFEEVWKNLRTPRSIPLMC